MSMRKPPAGDRQFDLFFDCLYDMPLRDQWHTMERPFFSLSKNKRIKPIEYSGVDKHGEVTVKVEAVPAYGMATIWDADILIWAVSKMIEQKRAYGNDDIARTLHFQPHDLLKSVRRMVGGDQYIRLREALNRLQTTTIETNIRSKDTARKKMRRFSWIDSWKEEVEEGTGRCKGMSLCVADWLYEGVHNTDLVLEISPDYFLLDGGIERWLYRVARKHAGHKEVGFSISVDTLFEKSGIEEKNKRMFKSRLKKIVKEGNDGIKDGERVIAKFPDYYLEWVEKTQGGGSAIHMTERNKLSPDHPGYQVRLPRSKNHPSE
ncbi:Plasmid replication initiator protein [Azospirillaceae bacterium]